MILRSPPTAEELTYDKSGNLQNTLRKSDAILQNDKMLKAIVFNQQLDGMEIKVQCHGSIHRNTGEMRMMRSLSAISIPTTAHSPRGISKLP